MERVPCKVHVEVPGFLLHVPLPTVIAPTSTGSPSIRHPGPSLCLGIIPPLYPGQPDAVPSLQAPLIVRI